MNRTSRILLLFTALLVATATVALLFVPNPFASGPCTTVSYGLPFPVKTIHCLCEKGRTSYSVWGVLGNIAIAIAGYWVVYKLLRRAGR